MDFQRFLAFTLEQEGGYCDRPSDIGGPTFKGVTLALLSATRKAPCTISELKSLTDQEVAEVYRSQFWEIIHGDDLPLGIDLSTFDPAVNSGPGHAIRWLQFGAGVTEDGIIGPETLKAVQCADPVRLIQRMNFRRRNYVLSLPNYPDNPGWLPRIQRVTQTAIEWAQGSNWSAQATKAALS